MNNRESSPSRNPYVRALLPQLGFTSLGTGPQTLELYVDLVCPHCARFTSGALTQSLIPSVSPGGKYEGVLRLIVRPYPQPWAPVGGWSIEALLAFGLGYCSNKDEEGKDGFDSELCYEYYTVLMERQSEFKDAQIKGMTMDEIKEKLYGIAREVLQRSMKDEDEHPVQRDQVVKLMSE